MLKILIVKRNETTDIRSNNNDNLLLPSQGINEKILKILNIAFEKYHNLKNNDKLILIEILENFKKIVRELF